MYGTCNANQTSRLQKVLIWCSTPNFAASVISGRRKFGHVSDVLRDLGWLTAQNMYTYHALTILNRVLTMSRPESLASRIVERRYVHQRTTRQGGMLHLPTIKSESGRRRFLYAAVTTFNNLPPTLRDLSPRDFKREIRRHLLQQQASDR